MGRWNTALSHLVAIAAVGAMLGLGGVAFIYSGLFEAEASKPHSLLVDWTTKTTMTHSVRRHAVNIEAPASATLEQVIDGFCQYQTHCVACHGAPAVPRESWANGLTPDPPYLVDARSKWRPRELYWIVRNGIKMTGMPAWERELSERQTWDVVAFLGVMPKLPPGTYASWRVAGLCGPAASQSATRPAATLAGLPPIGSRPSQFEPRPLPKGPAAPAVSMSPRSARPAVVVRSRKAEPARPRDNVGPR